MFETMKLAEAHRLLAEAYPKATISVDFSSWYYYHDHLEGDVDGPRTQEVKLRVVLQPGSHQDVECHEGATLRDAVASALAAKHRPATTLDAGDAILAEATAIHESF